MATDYYTILGVDKKASPDDIKKAFRKLAHKHHPDKQGGDAAKFKEASEAYAILSDEKKRAEYDTYGRVFSEGGGPGGGAGGFGGFDFSGVDFEGAFGDLGDLGSMFSDFFGGGGGRRGNRVRRGRDISLDLELTFAESIFGVERKMLVTKNTTCATCAGNGAKPGTELSTCGTCNGHGHLRENRRTLLGVISTERLCETCKGSGKIPKEKCATCHGEGIIRAQSEVSVKIPPGINPGEMIRLTGAGEALAGGTPGDLYIKIHVRPDGSFRKEGNDLLTQLKIKLSAALLGNEYAIKTLDGDLSVKIPAGISHGEVLRVRGKGVPTGSTKTSKRGDLLIRIHIEMPQKLSKKAQKLVEDLKGEGM